MAQAAAARHIADLSLLASALIATLTVTGLDGLLLLTVPLPETPIVPLLVNCKRFQGFDAHTWQYQAILRVLGLRVGMLWRGV